ncbi:MAG: hypothetical protein ACXW3C_18790 [Pyrinomonadaceae bacterium]
MRIRFLLHVAVPLMIGGAIYICWRDPSLVLFDWFHAIGLNSVVEGIRAVTLPYAGQLPRWLLYSLPDALWVYAAIMLMDCIWRERITSRVNRRLWLWSGPLLAIVIELGQLTGLVRGSFDPYDLVLSAAASFVAALVIITSGKSKRRIEKGTEYVQANKNELAVAGRA